MDAIEEGKLRWKAERYDKYEALIDEGKPIWEWDAPVVDGSIVRLSMFNNATGEIRQLRLTMADLTLLNRTGAFDKHSETFDEDRKRFETFVETIPE